MAKRRRLSQLQELNVTTDRYTMAAAAPMSSAAIASFVTSFNGVKLITDWMAGGGGNTELVALLVSFTGAGISFASWAMTIRFLRLYMTRQATAIGLMVMVYLASITLVASTFTSFIALTESSARGLYLMELSAQYAEYRGALRARVVALENTAGVIEQEASDACVKAETELKTGMISGSAGAGPVSSKLQTLCTRKRSMAEAVEETLSSLEPLVAEIGALSFELDLLILDTERSLSLRERVFIQEARKLEASLEDLRSADRMRSVRASYEAIGQATQALEALKGKVSQGQANALTEIIAAEKASSDVMQKMIDQIEAKPLPEPVRSELLPPPQVAVRYAVQHIPQAGLALSLDCFGPIAAALFFAARMRRRQPKKGPLA